MLHSVALSGVWYEIISHRDASILNLEATLHHEVHLLLSNSDVILTIFQ